MSRYIITIMIETKNEHTDELFVQEEITQKLVEERVLDCLDYEVTHVFTINELPES